MWHTHSPNGRKHTHTQVRGGREGPWPGKEDRRGTQEEGKEAAPSPPKKKNGQTLTPISRRFSLDASALTEKRLLLFRKWLSQAALPTKPPEPTIVVIETAPLPHPVYRTKIEPVLASVAPAEPSQPEPKSKLPWIIGLIVLLLAGGGLIVFAITKRKSQDDDEDEEERPRKKRKKFAKEVDEDESGNGKKRSGKHKAVSKRAKDDDD